MSEAISNTSPLQYLHQTGYLHLLSRLFRVVVVPGAVVIELARGRSVGVDLPDPALLPWSVVKREPCEGTVPADLGPGEREVLSLGIRSPSCLLLLDDAKARLCARGFGLRVTGTLGVLLEAKRLGHLPAVGPVVRRLETSGFRLSETTRLVVLRLAGESP